MPITRSKIGIKCIIHMPVNIYESRIGEGTKIGMFTEIGNAVIGEDCNISAQVFIPAGVEIEHDCFIGPGVRFCNVKHVNPYTKVGKDEYDGAMVEYAVVIGANSTILPGITLGYGCIIGAGSVVTHSVPPGETWYGNPARSDKHEECTCCHCEARRYHY